MSHVRGAKMSPVKLDDKSGDIFLAVSPILFVTRLVGLGPFRVDRDKKAFVTFVPALVFSGLMLVTYASSAAFLMYTKVGYKDVRIDSYVGLASDVILLTSGGVVTVCCILLTILQRKKYSKVVHFFHGVSFEMAKLNEEIPYRNLFATSRRNLFLLFLLLTLLFFHTVFSTENLGNVLYIPYMYVCFAPKIYNFLMEYQFLSGVFLLRMHYNLLNKSLETFVEPESDEDESKGLFDRVLMGDVANRLAMKTFAIAEGKFFVMRPRKIWERDVNERNLSSANLEKIKTIRKIHCKLCDITKLLNSAFSLQLLTSVAQAFVFITSNLYLTFKALSTAKSFSFMAISQPMLWFATHTIELLAVVLACTNTSKMANSTAVLVHKLLVKECAPEVRNQLKLFSTQLLHRKVFFTASGFFNIDMALLQATIGAVTTYLVILIQFHKAYEIPKKSYTVTDFS